jgi:hypothetical protein
MERSLCRLPSARFAAPLSLALPPPYRSLCRLPISAPLRPSSHRAGGVHHRLYADVAFTMDHTRSQSGVSRRPCWPGLHPRCEAEAADGNT